MERCTLSHILCILRGNHSLNPHDSDRDGSWNVYEEHILTVATEKQPHCTEYILRENFISYAVCVRLSLLYNVIFILHLYLNSNSYKFIAPALN
jgi:hypothetical protein